MTTDEHLKRIRARCVELLENGKKRTQGRWEHRAERVALWLGDECHGGDWIDGDMTEHDALFIASCAGPAEAGWKATIAAIDVLVGMIDDKEYGGGHVCDNDGRGCSACHRAEKTLRDILAAWPEEIL